jgi:hypothetical protein
MAREARERISPPATRHSAPGRAPSERHARAEATNSVSLQGSAITAAPAKVNSEPEANKVNNKSVVAASMERPSVSSIVY